MALKDTKYCIDTSSLLEIRSLDPDVFGIWKVLEDLVKQGVLHAPHEVSREVQKRDSDMVASWVKARKEMFFYPDDDLGKVVAEVQKIFTFQDPESSEPCADPFLVAHGIHTGCTIITQEVSNPKKKYAKIPDAGIHFKIRTINLSEFFREQGWTFAGQKV